MGIHKAAVVVVFRLLTLGLIIFPFLSGCQVANVPSAAKLVEHRENIDDAGLREPVASEPVKVNISSPSGWQLLGTQKAALYTHQQWRSPSKRTAVGVTYVKMPLPLSTKTLVWFAMNEAGKKANDGKIIRQWNDSLGREWFEAENNKYHMTGYVMTRGFDAWINYCGYRVQEEKVPAEIELGTKSLDSILPLMAVPVKKSEHASAE
jgi:hypothetical protein